MAPGALLGGYTTHSFGESPREGKEYRLSQILVDSAHPKYSLSATACEGILRRAKRRGKELPEELKKALEEQSVSRNAPENLGGKGILIQEEHVGALSTLNNQSVLQCVGVDVYNQKITGEVAASVTAAAGGTNHSGTKVLCLQGNMVDRGVQQNGTGVRENIAYTLDAVDRHAVCVGNGQLNNITMGEQANTLDTMHDKQAVMVAVDFRNGNENPEINGTLQAKNQGISYNLNNVVRVSAFTQNQRDEVRDLKDVAGSLAAEPGMKQQTYVFENHSQDSRNNPMGEICETVSAKYGTGGNNQPLVVFDKEMYNAGEKMTGEMQARYDNVAPTVRADSHPSGICTSVVRRLTPMECERLQGYPDGWTDIGDWTDSKGKKRKTADGPRYKALGNSIALPFWQFLARRICAQYERDITLGSLFDGIGGFPYVFERCGAKAVWASEIEEFAIAVTKKRFPEEDEG